MSQLAVVPDLEEELDRLYGLPLEEFTPARNDLARRLKRANQAEAATRVQALKKPSVPVWAANQLARRHADDVEALVDAGLRLREAQETAFRGEAGRAAVREATSAERDAARTLTRLAQELLEQEGRPTTRAVVDRIGALLRSAAITPAAGAALRAGRLTEEVETGGFDALAGLEVPKSRPRKEPQPPPRVDRRREQRLQRLRERYDELEQRARQAEREADDVERGGGRDGPRVERTVGRVVGRDGDTHSDAAIDVVRDARRPGEVVAPGRHGESADRARGSAVGLDDRE
jgi:hypothetical protein